MLAVASAFLEAFSARAVRPLAPLIVMEISGFACGRLVSLGPVEALATDAWPIDFCHDFQPIVSPGATGARGQGIASAFGTPVHWGCNDSVVADYRRMPSGSRGRERAGARLGAHL